MKEINEVFYTKKDFENWAQIQDPNSVFKIKIDNKSPDFWGIVIYSKEHFDNWDTDLILLSPLEVFNCGNHLYDVDYPQIGPINWKELTVFKEYTEEEAVRIIADDPLAKVYYGEEE